MHRLAGNNKARTPLIVYGAHVATTLVPIFGELYANKSLADNEKVLLVCASRSMNSMHCFFQFY
jgi:hypothetical protein